MAAMFDCPEVVGGRDQSLRKQKPRREMTVGAWRTHDDGERTIMQADLERLFDGDDIRLIHDVAI
jgi:hypothetical protein